MKDPDKIWEESNALKTDRHEWKMGINFKEYNELEFKSEMETKYAYLKMCSSSIYTNFLNGENLEMDKLKYMLDMMRSLKDKKMSHEEASKEVGATFAEQYIKPLVDKLEKEKEELERTERLTSLDEQEEREESEE
tara:strand:- start:87 stop:494 length:408 start_codon:yes stop_codon:yes gene_type:complete